MKKFLVNVLSATVIIATFSACTTPKVEVAQSSNTQMPKWIFSPNVDGILGAVGSAKVHFKGSAAQRDLAVQRALNELAKQHGVNVHTESSQEQKMNNGMMSSKAGTYSFQTSDGVVNAHIAEVWQDPNNKEIFVWMRDN